MRMMKSHAGLRGAAKDSRWAPPVPRRKSGRPIVSPEEWRRRFRAARKTAKWAVTMTKWAITYTSQGVAWKVVDFLGPGKGESRGVVDLVAIRRNHRISEPPLKRGDLLEILLIQVKGGSVRDPSPEDEQRLVAAKIRHGAKRVLRARWRKGRLVEFSELDESTRSWTRVHDLAGLLA